MRLRLSLTRRRIEIGSFWKRCQKWNTWKSARWAPSIKHFETVSVFDAVSMLWNRVDWKPRSCKRSLIHYTLYKLNLPLLKSWLIHLVQSGCLKEFLISELLFLCFKMCSGAKLPPYKEKSWLTYFHMKGFTLGLVLKQVKRAHYTANGTLN